MAAFGLKTLCDKVDKLKGSLDMAHMVQKVYEPHTPHDNHKYSSLHECFDDMCKLIGIVPVFNTICTIM